MSGLIPSIDRVRRQPQMMQLQRSKTMINRLKFEVLVFGVDRVLIKVKNVGVVSCSRQTFVAQADDKNIHVR